MPAHGNKHLPINDDEKLKILAVLAVAKVRFEKMRKASKENQCVEIYALKIGQRQYAEICLSCIRTIADMLSNGVTKSELVKAIDSHGVPHNAATKAMHELPNANKVNIFSMINFLKS